ncbi:dTDP-glucose 4,6-dehydratase [bacterium]|nr:MAG: dTDP-glucose 4,6-dehydratase [bacterium]
MKSLLVTGGAGFIGSNLIRYLLEESGYAGKVVNLDKLTYAGNLENLAGLEERFPGRYAFVRADIADGEAVEAAILTHGVDAICHLAAESHVDRSIAAPDDFIQSNVVGTFRLLELARKHRERIRRFHHVSTDEVFGSLGPEGQFREDTPYHPNSPYSASKAASDHLVRAYHHTYGLPVTVSNCSNNYGPYQFPEKLIPLLIANALEGKPLPIYGDGKNVRDWLYVRDHARALWTILQKGRVGETYNIGGRCEKTNLEVMEALCAILDKRAPRQGGSYRDLKTFVPDRPGHDRRYAMDCVKLEVELEWLPEESFESGLDKTVQWYLSNREWARRVQNGEYREWIRRQYPL